MWKVLERQYQMSNDWRPEGLKKYHEERELITEIVTTLIGRSNDLEEWYVYHIKNRDLKIASLEEEIRELKKAAVQS